MSHIGNSKAKVASRYKRRRVNWSWYESASEALESHPEKNEGLSQPNLVEVFRRRDFTDNVFARRVDSLSHAMVEKGKLSIKAYVADRLVLVASGGGAAGGKAPSSLAKHSARKARVLRLEKPHESRRGVLIGHRLRFKPNETKFTSYGRNFVVDAATLIERSDTGSSIFLTLTFPGRTEEALRLYSQASGWLVDRFNRWLRYKAANGLFLYVWERTKLGAPHLHYLFKTHGLSEPARISEECQREWRNILLDLCEETRCDVFAREGRGTWIGDRRKPFVAARPVTASHAQYLGKYLGKTTSKSGSGADWFPGRWWRTSQPLRKLVLASRLHVECRFPSQGEAKKGLSRALDLIGGLATSVYKCGKGRNLFSLVFSVSVPSGMAVKIASAIKSIFDDGDAQELFALRGSIVARAG